MIKESLKWVASYTGALGFCIGLITVSLVIILKIRRRAMKAKKMPKDYYFADSLHWILSPTTGKLLITSKEEGIDGAHQREDGDYRKVFRSKSYFSRCSSENNLVHSGHPCKQSIWENLFLCERWPFGLAKKYLVLPPLPSSPSNSWMRILKTR